MSRVSCVPLLGSRPYSAADNFLSIGVAKTVELAIRSVRPLGLPAMPGDAANHKLKFTGLQKSFSQFKL